MDLTPPPHKRTNNYGKDTDRIRKGRAAENPTLTAKPGEMIQANELRIGNWALYPHTIHEPFQITEPRHIELAYLLKPIPLTPEILEACGFIMGREITDRKVGYSTGLHQFEMQVTVSGGVLIGAKKYKVPMLCEYLHQLQNLYFALTGSELSINLEKVKV